MGDLFSEICIFLNVMTVQLQSSDVRLDLITMYFPGYRGRRSHIYVHGNYRVPRHCLFVIQ